MKSITRIIAALAIAAPISAANAADIEAVGYDWSGAYVGLNVGMADLDPKPHPNGFIQPQSEGILAGARLGYNHQINSFVMGVETDFNWTGLDKSAPCLNPAWTCNAGSDYNASIRGRLGFAVDRFMVFGTGGYAIADYNGFTDDNAGLRFSDSKTLGGWTAGGGIEFALTDTVLLNIEYSHMQFGKGTIQYDGPYPIRKPTIDQVKLGVSWKF